MRECSQTIHNSPYPSHRCHNTATIERNGKWYCAIHNPEYIKEKGGKWQAEFDAKWQAEREKLELRQARATATNGLTLAELKQITPELIRGVLRNKEVR